MKKNKIVGLIVGILSISFLSFGLKRCKSLNKI